MQSIPNVGVVIVSYGHEEHVSKMIDTLRVQMKPGDKLAVIDNKGDGGLRSQVESVVDYFNVLPNPGFAAASNEGARALRPSVDVLLFINPDTRPSDNCLDVVRGEYGQGYAAWMPILLLPDGRVNSAGNVVHMSGLSWCDGYLDSQQSHGTPKDIYDLSGACMAFDVEWWDKLGGMTTDYFLYYEDTDISSRIKLLGGKMRLNPAAYVEHDYDYDKGTHKWFFIERNRYIYIIENWPIAIILVLLPELIVADIGLWFIAILQGRFVSKFRAFLSVIKQLPRAIKSRSRVQKTRKISAYQYMASIHYKLDTPSFGFLQHSKIIESIFRLYYKAALALLKLIKV